ncbi:peroxiredoxin [Chelatococcus asaccharovorans]|uniref:thioredoxin-dependent peroxiredoxin n=1 Tax=Chelatococcus asaccharovorans TaxID=28210 RepID=A0A2V3UBM0_9HYPH|nr:peroxiredoxin [Chelatococcus asaccharovorans]MBS7703543.1 peroxiredoxin [Chelatococcus asaccharovorans]PXW61885.1 peroxiredoxin Q/BCP [Chelatococcus asaccharovorans]CAH1670220.1 putative peroxiredoxin bcp [Chelatococcus asaccharovorans]CAH1678344.1 putative peroxiredoxin bcp [Chelatococcus asaccharovorans]
MAVEAGSAAPAFELMTGASQRISLASLRGSKVVLYFYPKDDTSGCTREAIAFNALKADFAAADTAIVGVSADDVVSHDRFKAKHGLSLTLAADPEKSAIDAYGVWVEKSMYGRKYMGIERATFLIDETGKVAQVWRKVRVPGHAEEVLAAARSLAAREAS